MCSCDGWHSFEYMPVGLHRETDRDVSHLHYMCFVKEVEAKGKVSLECTTKGKASPSQIFG